jgi:hypothetical protein
MENQWDFRDEYDDICVTLFSCLVLEPAGIFDYKMSPSYLDPPEPLLFLYVIPNAEIPIMINREKMKHHGYWDYPVKYISSEEAKLCLIDFFDYDQLGFKDFRYCRVKIVASNNPDLVGRVALVEPEHVKFYLKEGVGS